MKILITGGAGYIGSHTAKHLSQAGHEIVVLDNLGRGHRWAVQWGLLEEVDLLDLSAVQRTLQRHRPDAVAHFAAYALVGESVQNPGLYYRNNFVGSLNLLEALIGSGCRKLVFSSTCAIYGNPQQPLLDESHPQKPVNPYGQSKLMVEQALADFATSHGLKSCALRYFNACGADPEGELGEVHDPETHLIPSIFNALMGGQTLKLFGDQYNTPDGTCIRDYINILDLASAHRLALEALAAEKPLRAAYNLGTGRGHSVREVIAIVETVTGRKVPVEIHPPRPGDPPSLVSSARLAQRDLGWQAEWTDLGRSVEVAWKWHQRWFNSRLSREPQPGPKAD
ncbi:MAG: UDP-glucose 4-epimerase GalE [Candidatus Eremiobacteraeota bacterium]|nr:UDP-glucose 4-epimerase GalE [Candidatus Eremiobacteraeota bacterium]